LYLGQFFVEDCIDERRLCRYLAPRMRWSSGLNAKHIQAMGSIGGILFGLIIPIAVCAYLGRRLDQHFATGFWFTLASFPLALVLAFLAIRRQAQELKRDLSSPAASSSSTSQPPS
jgi:F0F1-type ATP synthase assembly protein I